MLFACLLATLGALLGVMDGDVEQCLCVATWGRLPTTWGRAKFCHLIIGGILGGNIVQLLDGVPKNVVRNLETRWLLCVAHAVFEHFGP
jgi:hypothetical protein